MAAKYDLKTCLRVMDEDGIDRREVAARAGVSNQTVTNFLSGRSVRPGTAKKIIEIGLRIGVKTVLRGAPAPRRRKTVNL